MKRHNVSPLELSRLQNLVGVDILIPMSAYTGAERTNASENTFDLVYDVSYYNRLTPRLLEVFTYGKNAEPAIRLQWEPGEEKPRIPVLLDSSVEVKS